MSQAIRTGFRFFFFIILLFVVFPSYSQDKEVEDVVKRASELFERKEYSEAKDLYSQLVSLYPKDPNFNYRFGACLIAVDEDKTYPLKFLEYAVSKPNVEVDAFYFLGKGYHYNYRFDEAIIYLNKYKDKLDAKSKSDYPVDQDIRFCKNGKLLLRDISTPLVVKKSKVSAADFFTSFKISSMGGRMMYAPKELHTATDKKKGYVPVMYKNSKSKWVYYSSYGPNEKNGLDLYKVSVSDAGLIGEPIRLPDNINTSYDERFPFLNEDESKFYFSSTGHNSMGGADIFVASHDSVTKVFGAPVNLDYSINTPDDDFMYAELGDNSGIAFFASNRNSEKGKAFVYKINAKRKAYEIAVVAGVFISENTKSCKITVEDLEEHVVVSSYNSNKKSGEYVMRLKKGGKYSFLVEPHGGEVAYKGRVELPYQDEIKVLRQEIEIVKDESGERLIIRNLFEEDAYADDSKIIAQVLVDNANIEESKPVEVTISPEEMVASLEKDKTSQQEIISELTAKKDASFALANEKRELAHKDLELADQIEKQIDLNDDGVENIARQKEFSDLVQDARIHTEEAEAAYKIGQKFEEAISKTQMQINETEGYIVRVQGAKAENDGAGLTDLYTQYTNEKSLVSESLVADQLADDVKEESGRMTQAVKKAERLAMEQESLKEEIAFNKAQKKATKKKKEKEEIQVTIDELELEIDPLEEDRKKALAVALVHEKKVNELKVEQNLVNEVSDGSTENVPEVTLEQKNAMLASIEATSSEISALESVALEMEEVLTSDSEVATTGNDFESEVAGGSSETAMNEPSENSNDEGGPEEGVENELAQSDETAVNSSETEEIEVGSESTASTSEELAEGTAVLSEASSEGATENGLEIGASESSNAEELALASGAIEAGLNQEGETSSTNAKEETKSISLSENNELGEESSESNGSNLNSNEESVAQEQSETTNTSLGNSESNSEELSGSELNQNTIEEGTDNSNSEYFEYTTEYEEPVDEVILVDGQSIPLEITSNTGKRQYKPEELKNAPVVFTKSSYNETFDTQYQKVKTEENPVSKAKAIQQINYNWVVAIEKEVAELSYAKENSTSAAYNSRIDAKMDELKDQASQKRNFMALNSRIIKQLETQEAVAENQVGSNEGDASGEESIETANEVEQEELNNELALESASELESNTNQQGSNNTEQENPLNSEIEGSPVNPDENLVVETAVLENATEQGTESSNESLTEEIEGSENEVANGNTIENENINVTEPENSNNNLEQGNELAEENSSIVQNEEGELNSTEQGQSNQETESSETNELTNEGQEESLEQSISNSNSELASETIGNESNTEESNNDLIQENSNNTKEEKGASQIANTETDESSEPMVETNSSNENFTASENNQVENQGGTEPVNIADLTPIQEAQISPSAVVVTQIEIEKEVQEAQVVTTKNELTELESTLEETKKKKQRRVIEAQVESKKAEVAFENQKLKWVESKKEDVNLAQTEMVKDPLSERPSTIKFSEARKLKIAAGDLQSELEDLEFKRLETKKKKKRRVIDAEIVDVKRKLELKDLEAQMAEQSAMEMETVETETLKKLTPYGQEVLVKLPEIENEMSAEQFEEVEQLEAYVTYSQTKEKAEKEIQSAAVMFQSAKNKEVEVAKIEEEISLLQEGLDLLPAEEQAPVRAEINEKRTSQKRIIAEAQVMYQEAKSMENDAYYNLNEANAELLVLDDARERTLIFTAVNGNVRTPIEEVAFDSANIDAIPTNLTTDIFVDSDSTFYNETKPIPVDVELPKGVILKVQIGAFRNPINQATFKGFAPIVGEKTSSGLTRYTAGLFKDFETANGAKNGIRAKGYSDAFVVAYLDGKRISISEARRVLAGEISQTQVAVTSEPSASSNAQNEASVSVTEINSVPLLPGQGDIEVAETSTRDELFFTVQVGVYSRTIQPGSVLALTPLNSENIPNNLVRYSSGVYGSIAKASAARNGIIQSSGISDAFVTAYYKGSRISLTEARALVAQQVGTVTNETNIAPVSSTTEETTTAENGSGSVETSLTGAFFVTVGPYTGGIPIEEAREILTLNALGVVVEKNNGATLYKIGNFTNRQEAEALKVDLESKGLNNPTVKQNEE